MTSLAFRNGDPLVRRNILDAVHQPAGPAHGYLIHALARAEPEVKAPVILGQETAPRSNRIGLPQFPGHDFDPSPDAVAVTPRADRPNFQPVSALVTVTQERR